MDVPLLRLDHSDQIVSVTSRTSACAGHSARSLIPFSTQLLVFLLDLFQLPAQLVDSPLKLKDDSSVLVSSRVRVAQLFCRLHRLLASVDATRVWQAGAVVAVLLLKALPILQKWRWLGADLALEVLWLEESAVKLV